MTYGTVTSCFVAVRYRRVLLCLVMSWLREVTYSSVRSGRVLLSRVLLQYGDVSYLTVSYSCSEA